MSYSLMCGPAPDDDGYGVCSVCQRIDCLCEPNTFSHCDDPVAAAIEREAFEYALNQQVDIEDGGYATLDEFAAAFGAEPNRPVEPGEWDRAMEEEHYAI